MTPQNKHKKEIDAIIEEFDRLYIHENHWKSDNEEYAYAPIDGMRQFIFDNLHKIYSEGFRAGREEIIKGCLISTSGFCSHCSALSNNPQDE